MDPCQPVGYPNISVVMWMDSAEMGFGHVQNLFLHHFPPPC